jgi:hypothetical protein
MHSMRTRDETKLRARCSGGTGLQLAKTMTQLGSAMFRCIKELPLLLRNPQVLAAAGSSAVSVLLCCGYWHCTSGCWLAPG